MSRPWEVHGTIDYTPEQLARLERMALYLIRRTGEEPSIMDTQPWRINHCPCGATAGRMPHISGCAEEEAG